ncbi:MAG TPA: TIGR03086 family metal-binding protein [Pseudonocardia sp.]
MTALAVADLYARCDAAFAGRLEAVDGRWAAPTALPGWDVRALVHHIVVEERWTPPLFSGLTITEVSDLDGDLLGSDPMAAARDAAKAALAAATADGVRATTVHLSFGAVAGAEYARQLAADHLVHAWDLARALGVDDRLDAGAVHDVLTWFTANEDAYRGVGLIGPRVTVPEGADEQSQLLARFGRVS